MVFEHIDEKEAVKRAALIEINGFRFYNLLAERTESRDAKAVFKKLAEDERKHLKIIENKFYPEAGFNEQITEEELQIEEYVEHTGAADIFTRRINIEALLKIVDTTKKALNVALDTERHSVKYFEELGRKTSAIEARKIYNELAEEEKAHVSEIEALMNSDGAAWKK
ncbi:MAG: ferritin family protein [Deltaproteobacteria bacterium]|nr:ferritin family protein [Deltaproteobacteria bacterium]